MIGRTASGNGSGCGGRQFAIRQSSTYRYGEHAECELCSETKQCFDEHGLLACRECQSTLLPKNGLL